MHRFGAALLSTCLGATALARADQPTYAEQAEALRSIATTPAANAWLDEAARLPEPSARTMYVRRSTEGNVAYTQEEFDEAPEDEQARVRRFAGRYYETFYGSPLAYLRAIDLGAQALAEGDEPFSLEGARVFDLGYGQIGQLRMLAQAGAHAVGADPDPILRTLYSFPGDTGAVQRDEGPDGSITLACGVWPADEHVRETVGDGFDLIIARNLLKRGYIDPPQETPEYTRVGFGVPDAELLRALHDALRPGGVLVVYSLGGVYIPPGPSYSPSADIANPWTEADWKAAGFEVIAQDANEDAMARKAGEALGWREMGMDLENQLFGVYSIYRHPAKDQ